MDEKKNYRRQNTEGEHENKGDIDLKEKGH